MLRDKIFLIILLLTLCLGIIIGLFFHDSIQQALFHPTSSLYADTAVVDFTAVDNLNRSFTGIARRITPAVVTITAEKKSRLSGAWEEWFRQYQKHSPESLLGSGVIVRKDGYILTNEHVIKEAINLKVKLFDKRLFSAKVIGSDPLTDIALLKIDADQLPVAVFGNSDGIQTGEWVLAIGSPMNLNSTVTAGIVSATGRSINIIGNEYGIEHFIQTDAAVNPGNSGGALVNMHGELIGINTAIASRTGMYQGYGFAVPINLARHVMENLIRYGAIERGYIGVQVQEITRDYAQMIGLKKPDGVLVMKLTEQGSAHQAGIKEGDVILSVDDKTIGQPSDLQAYIAMKRPGDSVSLLIFRNGRELSQSVMLQQSEN